MDNRFFKYKRCLLLIIFVAYYSGIYSQSVLRYDYSSPEVGSLLRVEDNSVNLYTGRPHISVPLYSMTLKNFTYNIELLYNAEGNKPDMPVSNTGLGWAITGGQIYRVTNGIWDEVYTFTQYLDRTERQDWNQESNLRDYYDDIDDGTDENFEKEPDLDEFIINIGRINASFYMYQDREGKIVTKIASQNSSYFEVKDVKIGTFPEIPFAEDELYVSWMNETYYPKISIVPRSVLFKEITIVDSDGVTYIFGGDVNSIDFSCEYFQDTRYTKEYDVYGYRKIDRGQSWEDYHSCLYGIPSAWHIKKIILPNEKESIDFHYSKGNVNIMERINLHENFAYGMYGPVESNTVSFINIPDKVDPEFQRLRDKTYDIVYPSLLTGIYASNGDFVKFSSSKRHDLRTDGMYERKSLFLCDNYGGLLTEIADNKCYSFKLDKIETGTGSIVDFYYTDKNDRRLILDSLKIDRNEIYKFQYNPQLLPNYGKTLTDNWGYYNGKDYYPKRWSLNFDNLYAVRQPDFTYVKAEILEKIIYPTGGEVLFQYELHDYAKIATQYPFDIKEESGVAGGVRIKKMIYSDTVNSLTTKTKEFLYLNEDGNSSGILSVIPQYAVSGRDYYTRSNTQMNWVDQFHMVYSRVTELLSDGSKTVYSFVNHDQVKDEPSVGDYTLGVSDFLYHKYTSRKLDRGLLQSAKYYDTANKLLKQEVFNYHSDLSEYLKTINQYYFIGGYPRRISANKIYTHFPFLQKKETTLYFDRDSINETEEYEYNRYRLLTRTRRYTNHPNENSMLDISIKYLSDLMEDYNHTVSSSIPASSTLKVYDTMNSKRLLASPIETVIKRNGNVTSSEVMTYKLSNNFVVLDKQYKLESGIPLNDYSSFKLISPTQYSIDERCTVEMEYLDYDSYCNSTNVVDKSGVHTAYIWGYKGQYPVAKVVNAWNTFKSIPKYRDVKTSKYVYLKYNSLSSSVRSYNFYTSKAGDVEMILSGALGYNWYVTGSLDGNKNFNLVQTRCYKDMGRPWSDYVKAYTYRATFYVSAGYHTLRIFTTDACKDPSTSGTYDGDLHFSYWTQESIAPETSGADEIFYENFETSYVNSSSFGYNSNNSFTGVYPVSLNINPEREYVMDYQVFKNGKWNYKRFNFINGCDTINEGIYPIDDVRVYPIDASISTYNYYPLIGLRSETNERGVSESYNYNSFGRLTSVVDNDMNIVRKYDCSYRNQSPESEVIFYNNELSESFTRNTCDASLGELGLSIDYVVPVKKYSSTLSQEDANQKAYTDLLNNGQQYANENGECSANIILSVYNPQETPYFLEFSSGIQGSIVYDHYLIPLSEKIADTGDILKDYKPVIVYLPRKNYRSVSAYQEDDYSGYVALSVKSCNRNFELFYMIEYYPDYQDTYVIGNYIFPDKLK